MLFLYYVNDSLIIFCVISFLCHCVILMCGFHSPCYFLCYFDELFPVLFQFWFWCFIFSVFSTCYFNMIFPVLSLVCAITWILYYYFICHSILLFLYVIFVVFRCVIFRVRYFHSYFMYYFLCFLNFVWTFRYVIFCVNFLCYFLYYFTRSKQRNIIFSVISTLFHSKCYFIFILNVISIFFSGVISIWV